MNHQDILRDCATLRARKSLETIFHLTCLHGEADAAMWLEGDEIRTLSFAEYEKMTDDYAAYLESALDGFDRCAIMMDTCKEWFPTFWGLVRAGKNAVLLPADLSEEMTAYMLGEAGCHAVITGGKRTLPEGTRQISAAELFACPRVNGFEVKKWGEWVAMCTSGSTGTSRIFTYNGEALANQVLGSELIYQENHRLIDNVSRRTLAFLPYHHVLGFVANLLWCSFLGYTTVYLKDRMPQTILHTCQVCEVGQVISVPILANNIVATMKKRAAAMPEEQRAAFMKGLEMSKVRQAEDPEAGLKLAREVLFPQVQRQLFGTHVDSIVLGGGHTPPETLEFLNAIGYYTICGFGMTETAVTSFETSMNWDERVSGSVGKPLSNLEYRVKPNGADPDTGEMFIRGESIHTGRLVGGKLLPPDTEDGWIATGDVVHQEENGHIRIVGRTKDVIVNESGENVYPDELEERFAALTGVKQFSILGTPKQGLYEDITLVACVDSTEEEAMEKLAAQVRKINATLPVLKKLTRAVAMTTPLPMVNGIKVKRLALKKMIADVQMQLTELALTGTARSAEATAPAIGGMEELRREIHELAAKTLEIDPAALRNDASLVEEMGGDSLQILALSMKAEERFGVLIESEEYARCTTVNDLAELIWEKRHGTEKNTAERREMKPVTRFEDAPEYLNFKARQESLTMSGADDPYFVCHESPLLDKSMMAGQEVLNFGSYNYVGMSGRKEVSDGAKAAIDKYGTSASGSRLLAGEKKLHQELEKEIADWKHTESAVVCVGGHSTNVTFVGNFCGPNDLILYDALAHNSIEQGCRLSKSPAKAFPHSDTRALEAILAAQRKYYEKVLIVIEGAYSMDGDIAPVPEFVALKKKYGCFLMVDEAHSACVIGEHGGGVDEYFNLAPDDVDIKMGTLSKGLGTCGGYLAGKACLIEYMKYNMPGFVFSVGVSPALAGGTLAAIRTLRAHPEIVANLHRNIDCFAAECRKRHLDICLAGETAIIPVLVGRDEDAFRLSNEMRRAGVFVPPAVYPAVPRGKARLRFNVISEHTPEQIVRTLDTLQETAARLEIDLPRRDYE